MTVTIRLAADADAAALARIYAPSIGTATSFEATAPDQAEMRARLQAVRPYAPWLVCARGDDIWGYAYAARHRDRAAYRWSIDASVYIDARYHRRGVGRALYTSLFALCGLQGFYTVHGGITLPNPASVALHEAFGFAPVGVYRAVGYKLGAWHDVGWWQLALRDRVGEPAEPRTPAELSEDPRWAAAIASGVALLAT